MDTWISSSLNLPAFFNAGKLRELEIQVSILAKNVFLARIEPYGGQLRPTGSTLGSPVLLCDTDATLVTCS